MLKNLFNRSTRTIEKDYCFLDLSTFIYATELFSKKAKLSRYPITYNTQEVLMLLELNVLLESICLYKKILIPIDTTYFSSGVELGEREFKRRNEFTKALFDSKIVSLVNYKEMLSKISTFKGLYEVKDGQLPFTDVLAMFDWSLKSLAIHEGDTLIELLKANNRNIEGESIKQKSLMDSAISYTKFVKEINANTNTHYYPGIFNTPIYTEKLDKNRQLYNSFIKKYKNQIINKRDVNN